MIREPERKEGSGTGNGKKKTFFSEGEKTETDRFHNIKKKGENLDRRGNEEGTL